MDGIKRMIIHSGGIDYTQNKIIDISNKAKKALDKFPKSNYKEALILAVDFNIGRDY